MKKNLTHLAGIVFLSAVLAAGSFNPAKAQDPKKVVIYVKAVVIDGENHLEMYHEDDEGNVTITVTDDDTTGVDKGTSIVWRRALGSRIKKFKSVAPLDTDDKVILPQPAEAGLLHKRYRHTVPETVTVPGEDEEPIIEKYIIEVEDIDGNTWSIDPYLQLPPNK